MNDPRIIEVRCIVKMNVPATICKLGGVAVMDYLGMECGETVDEVEPINFDCDTGDIQSDEELRESIRWAKMYLKEAE